MLSTDKQTNKQTDRQTDKLTNATKNITSFAKEVITSFHPTDITFSELKYLFAERKELLSGKMHSMYPSKHLLHAL